MNTRRTFLTGIGAIGVGSVAGCLDLITGEELTFESNAAEVGDSTVDEAGFSHRRTESLVAEETVDVGGNQRDVTITSWTASYAKSFDLPTAGSIEVALFSAISTPNFEIAGQSVNPLKEMEHKEIIQEFSGQFEGVGDIRDIEVVEEGSETVLGNDADLTIFSATVVLQDLDEEVDALIYVTDTEHEDDVILGVGAHVDEFQGVSIDESENIRAMMRGIDHPVEVEDGSGGSDGGS